MNISVCENVSMPIKICDKKTQLTPFNSTILNKHEDSIIFSQLKHKIEYLNKVSMYYKYTTIISCHNNCFK